MAARIWSTEQRQRQREKIQSWQPWSRSTGPKSKKGKVIVSQNAFAGGYWRELRVLKKAVNQALRDHKQRLENISEMDDSNA